MRISNSFSEGEIQVLEFIVQTLLRGGTPTMATRSADFPSLCRKVQAMKKKVHEQKARPLANPEESSVGTVAAPTLVDAGQENRQEIQASGDHVSVDIARAV
jgi:hypothetical protein